MVLSVEDWLETIGQQPDAETRWQKTLQAFAAYGFDHIIFMNGTSLTSIQGRISGCDDFMRYYHEQQLYRHDPLVRLCASSYRSVRTGGAHRKSMGLSTAEQRMVDEVIYLGHGFNSGFTCTLSPLQQGRLSAWNIGTQLSVAETDSILATYQADLQQLCYLAPQLLLQPLAPQLSKREQQVLKLLAYGGLQYQQIANELNISVSTVRFHFGNIRQKFKANTNGQVIARAVQAGALQPLNLFNS